MKTQIFTAVAMGWLPSSTNGVTAMPATMRRRMADSTGERGGSADKRPPRARGVVGWLKATEAVFIGGLPERALAGPDGDGGGGAHRRGTVTRHCGRQVRRAAVFIGGLPGKGLAAAR